MVVHSFAEHQGELKPVQVEIKLWPGLPGMQILGRPDDHVRESVHRVRSALQAQGYALPKAKQILVNLKPSHFRKSSRGLELAVALAYIFETAEKQSPLLADGQSIFAYGELNLQGEVITPADIHRLDVGEETLITGSANLDLPFPSVRLRQLKDVQDLQPLQPAQMLGECVRPQEGIELSYTEAEAQLLKVIAVGEHSCLFVGASGTGKTTLASNLLSFLEEPPECTRREWRRQGWDHLFRPLIRPHHTTPVMSMLGGGNTVFAGEIAKADGGVLLLDELLEFHPVVLEAMREPMEEQKLRVSRRGKTQTFPAQCLVLATSNLCPCGDYTPGFSRPTCSYSLARCRSTLQKLSGPFLDRFQMLHFHRPQSEPRNIQGSQIFEVVRKAIAFRKKRGQKVPNSRLSLTELAQGFAPGLMEVFPRSILSGRRKLSLLRVARTFADLKGSEFITGLELHLAAPWAWQNFHRLSQWD